MARQTHRQTDLAPPADLTSCPRCVSLQVKIAWSFYQVATLIPEVYLVQLPAQVTEVLEFFRLSIELDAWNVHISCCASLRIKSAALDC